ncbi:MAG: hypothetical protein H0V04_08000 [Chloroflexi bacterium]|nr:hypothetical protein [Chloroflexota bacterium]
MEVTRRPGDPTEEPEEEGRHVPQVLSAAASLAASAAGSVGSLASAAAGSVGSAASAAAGSVGSVASAAIGEADHIASAARRRVALRGSGTRRRGTQPLPMLYGVHPEARRANPRDRGLEIVPLEQIRGTAVEGSGQRGSDFRPLPALRGKDWEARWQRIIRAVERLEMLPPIDLIKFGDDYWIIDGHNRVAAARQVGQVALDANVTELRPLGAGHAEHRRIAPYLTDSAALQAVGSGRRSPTASSYESLEPERLASERRAMLEGGSATHEVDHGHEAADATDRLAGPDAPGDGGR